MEKHNEKNSKAGEAEVPMGISPPQIPQGLFLGRTWASALTGGELTALGKGTSLEI